MFVIAPAAQPVLPVWSRQNAWFPVRRVLLPLEAPGAWASLPAEVLLPVAEDSRETLPLPEEAQIRPVLLAALSRTLPAEPPCTPSLWGWCTGLEIRSSSQPLFCLLAAAPLRPRTAVPSPLRPEAPAALWAYCGDQRAQTPEDASRDLLGRLTTLGRTGLSRPGDVVIAAAGAFRPARPGEVWTAGAAGIGTVSLRCAD